MSNQTDSNQAKTAGFMRGTNLSVLNPGMTFPVTWSFQNTGSNTWNGRYTFVYSETPHPETEAYPRGPLSQQKAYAITEIGAPTQVPPGGIVNLTITIVVPPTEGTHATNWQLQAPDGTRFGPIRWVHVVVSDWGSVPPPPLPPQTKPLNATPDSWQEVIWKITSVFESGSPEGRPSAYQNQDAGIVSFGKHQATLQSGNLERVLNAYFQRSSSAASQILQNEFAQRIARKEESLRHDERFQHLLLEASQEPAMSDAQDENFAEIFYQPAVEKAQELGLRTALSLACLYDTRIQGGLGQVITAVSQKLGVSKVGETGQAGPVDEPAWLRAFLDEREARLHRLAAQRESEGKLTDAEWLRTSTFRVTELRRLLEDGNLELAGEFIVRDHRIQGQGPRRERPEPPTGAKAGPTPVISAAVYHGPPVKFAAGLHGPGDAHTWHDTGFRTMLKNLDMPIKFMSDGDRFHRYAEFHKPQLNLVRVFWKPDPSRRKTAKQAWDEDIRDGVLNFYKSGARNFEVHNEPRLHYEGMGHQWHNGAEFGDFLRELMLIIKQNCPEARLWYPGESPGVPWTDQFAFTIPAYKKVSDLCAGLCQHAYSGNTTEVDTAVNDIVEQVRDFHKAMGAWNKPIIVSECSVNRAATPAFRAKVYTKAAQQMSRIPGVQGVFWYISHWNAPEPERANAESWYGTDLPDRYRQGMPV